MKVATEIPLAIKPEKIWQCLIEFSAYPDWNRFVKSIQVAGMPSGLGTAPTPDTAMDIQLHFYGRQVEKIQARLSGFIAPKYLSWTWKHRLGGWFMAMEHVFRIREREDGRVIFHQELYYTGLGLKFRRRDVEHTARLSLGKLNDDLTERLGLQPD